MIIYADKSYATHSLYPDTDWTGKAAYVIDDNSKIANKIRQNPLNYDLVVAKGKLIDVTPLQKLIIEVAPTKEELLQQEIIDLKNRVSKLESTKAKEVL